VQANLSKILYVEAAHSNPNGGEPQQRLHGHSYKIEVLAQGEVDPNVGWIGDYGELKQRFQGIYAQLDHGYLNELPGLEEDTTLPALERWIVETPGEQPPWFAGVRVSIVGDLTFNPISLPPNPTEDLPQRLFMTFEAAQSLPQLPGQHPCKKIHGHSYRLEVATPDLDTLKPHLQKLYNHLDHQFLNEIPGLQQATCERTCAWIWNYLKDQNQTPIAIVIQETASARCIYRG
jgi:6-pyruvoyltetrahydropterin/6-carboxytetrahydropterin synthase